MLMPSERVEIDAQGWPVDTESDFAITIPPGLFQLGCPFYFPVSWWEIKVRNGDVTVPVGNPANQWISPLLREYEEGRYLSAEVIEPWKGYWVENVSDEEVELLIPPKMFFEQILVDVTFFTVIKSDMIP